jgi:hypothetical protein
MRSGNLDAAGGQLGVAFFLLFFFLVEEFGALGLQYSSVCSRNQLQKNIAMKNLWINVLLLLLAATFSACGGGGGGGRGMIQVVEATFYFNFYEKSCPHAEKIVKEVVLSQFKFNQGIAPGLLRLFFHDCFVEVKYLGTKLQLLQLYSYFGIRAQICDQVQGEFYHCCSCHHKS